MPDDQSSNSRSDDDSSGRIWQGLKHMLFGAHSEPSLREQIQDVIDEAEDDGGDADGASDLSAVERKMLRNLLHFGEKCVDDVAVPRADIIAIAETASFAEIVAQFAEAGHSRLPVFRDDLDHIVGMIHVKDVFAIMAAGGADADMATLMRQPRYVPQSMGVLDLLAEMRATRTHLAIVIDEYSGTDGLVTIEDLVEEIVGEIEDEHDDEPAPLLVAGANGTWDADARAELDEVGDAVDARLADVDEDVDTLGGLAVVLAGHVPQVGERLSHPSGWSIEVLAGDERRLDRLRLYPPPQVDSDAVL